MRASAAEIPTLAQNIVLVASYWMSFEFARDPRAPQDDKTLARGAFHVIALAAPYLEPRERELFDHWRSATSPEEDAMAAVKWKPFPYDAGGYRYEGAALKRAWPELHRGDCEPFPDAAFVKQGVRRASEDSRAPRTPTSGGGAAIGVARLSPRRFRRRRRGRHGARADRRQRRQQGGEHLCDLSRDRRRAEARDISLSRPSAPRSCRRRRRTFVNAFYFHAQALGRYAQEISVVKALAQGIGDKVKASLDKAIRLEPNHAEAHIALGAYHAEIVSKVGGMLAKLTYGASKEEAVRHFALARKLLPESAIARIEEANGLVMLFGKAKLAEAESFTRKPRNARPPTRCKSSTPSTRRKRRRGE